MLANGATPVDASGFAGFDEKKTVEALEFYKTIAEEYSLTLRLVLEITGKERLLDADPALQLSVDLRNRTIVPLVGEDPEVAEPEVDDAGDRVDDSGRNHAASGSSQDQDDLTVLDSLSVVPRSHLWAWRSASCTPAAWSGVRRGATFSAMS